MSDTITTEQVSNLLTDMIAIDSVNHNFRENRAGEADLCDWVEFFLQSRRIPFERQSVRNHQRNLVARIEGADPSRAVCFEAHLDTTTARGMTVHPFGAEVSNGSIYGRGACDSKGSVAAMLAALAALHESGVKPPQTVIFAATVDREVGMTGIQRLLAPTFRPAAAVVGEPTNLGVGRCSCGCLRWRFAIGESPQSYAPPTRNAIADAVHLLATIERRIAGLVADRQHPLLGPARVRPVRIRANALEGFLPAHCAVEFECFTVSGCESSVVLEETDSIISGMVSEASDLKVAMEAPSLNDAPVDTPEKAPVVQAAVAAAREVLGEARIVGHRENGHANRFHAAGVPVIAFGPGDPKLARACDERIEAKQLAQAAEIYLKIMQSYV